MAIDIIRKAQTAKKESKYVDFKTSFDGSNRAWLKMLKSIVAMANTDGGVLVFGVNDNGTLSGFDVEMVLQIDPATITDKIYSHTNVQFDDFDILETERDGAKVALLIVNTASTPLVFKTPGVYANEAGKSITVFQAGTLFYRHGAKSEPANTDDVRTVIDKRVEAVRQEWFKEVRKVVEAPVGTRFVVESGARVAGSENPIIYRTSTDENIPATRFTRSQDKNAPVLLREELSEDLFQEVNIVLEANNLLARGEERFVFDTPIYYWIYSKRRELTSDAKKLELLIRCGQMQIYGPSMYLFLKLPVKAQIELIKDFSENPKMPHVNSLIRLMVLFGSKGANWLFEVWKRKMPGKGQHPDFYWKLKAIVEAGDYDDRKLVALKTLSNSNQAIEDGGLKFEIEDLLQSSDKADSLLTQLCLRVYDGEKQIKNACRRLDVLAYGDDLIKHSEKILGALP